MQQERDPQTDRQSSGAVTPSDAEAHAERRHARDMQRNSKVSVVVPTCGRADLLNRCLSALTAQTVRSADMEIIVVDDAALDATRAAIAVANRMGREGLRRVHQRYTWRSVASRIAGVYENVLAASSTALPQPCVASSAQHHTELQWTN